MSIDAFGSQNVYGSQPTNSIHSVDAVTPEVLKQFNDQLQALLDLLKKGPPYTEADSLKIQEIENNLKKMQTTPPGLETNMNNMLQMLFGILDTAADPNTHLISPSAIEVLSTKDLKIDGQTIQLSALLTTFLSPDYNPNATKQLGDMLLDFSKWAYNMYTDQLKDLKDQIDVATKSINDLKALQDILNMTTVDDPGNYKNPPQSWDDIPKPIQDKLRAEHPEWFLSPADQSKVNNYMKNISKDLRNEIMKRCGPFPLSFDKLPSDLQGKVTQELGIPPTTAPSDFNKVKNWIHDNGNAYATMSDDYFKSPLIISADPQPDTVTAINRVLASRDDIKAQIKALEDGGADSGEGSPLATLKAVEADLDKQFPPDQYPIGSQVQEPKKKKIESHSYVLGQPNKSQLQVVPPGTVAPVDPNKALSDFILSGQDKTKGISTDLDKAVTANQNLSSKMSDEIKAKNLMLQTMFDILTQIQDALNKSITGAAQKINR
eukprot:GDKI01046076.1.p1 GENE.GDKI01046076.1~~GDKI01046076.1.p1  ORF type:complete len:491 (+),score=-3.77 GDKI01046076.1:509-1981(+)